MPHHAVRELALHAAGRDGDVISISDACKLLGVHRNTLYRLIREAELPAFRMTRGGRWKFRRTDLCNWLEDKQGARWP